MLLRGELKKLRIIAYSDPGFQDEVGGGEFTTLINPEKYSMNYSIVHNDEQAAGTSTNGPKFTKTLPENLDLDFVFDRTGVVKNSESSDVGIIDEIEHFKKVVFDYNGDVHKPNYLKISWGALLFKGTLTEMGIEYKLFNPDGAPIRAAIRTKFKGSIEDELRVAMANNQSPDLTHLRTVKDGDTLPLMSHNVYGDSKYYLAVAKVNNIYNFRNLKTGQQLFFPPLAKI